LLVIDVMVEHPEDMTVTPPKKTTSKNLQTKFRESDWFMKLPTNVFARTVAQLKPPSFPILIDDLTRKV
jgi:hypothetical protein